MEPKAPTLSKPPVVVSPWLILTVLSLGFFMILLDTTVVNVAIPSMIDGLHASLDQILWVLNGYILIYAILLITAGRMGDMFGPKRLFLGGLVLFTASSAACGLAQSPDQLILFRVIQAVGGALLTPQSLAIITSIFPAEKRGPAFGLWSGVAGLAAVAGPTLGGYLTTQMSWRAIFFINVPIGIAAVILAFLMMPEVRQHNRHRLDVLGVLLATGGLFSLVFALIEGQRYNWGQLSSAASFSLGSLHISLISIPALFVLSAILLVAFILWEMRQEEPLLPLSLFKDRNFSVANVVSPIVSFGMMGLFLPLTIFLQSVLNLSAEDAGVTLVPLALTSMFVAPVAGRMSDRLNAKYLLFVGLILFSTGFALVIWLASLHSTGLTFTPALIIGGVGMGLTFAPMVTVAMRNISPRQAGSASGVINTVRQVGGAFGSAVVGAILQNRLAVELHSYAVSYATQLPAHFRQSFVTGFSHAAAGGFSLGRGQTGAKLPSNLPPNVAGHIATLGDQVFYHAYLSAMKPTLAVPIIVLLIGAIVSLFLKPVTPVQARSEVLESEGAQSVAAVAD
ncbi:MAG: DHA2 family efflux MFS transporter permease subunit [Chloroflexota bacterium]